MRATQMTLDDDPPNAVTSFSQAELSSFWGVL